MQSHRTLRPRLALAGLAGAVLTAIAAAITAGNVTGEGTALAAVARAATVAVPIAVGLYAWYRRPGERFGRLLVAVGAGWFLTTLAQSGDSLPYSIGRVSGWVMEVGLIFLILSFPTGRLSTAVDRALVRAGVALLVVLYLPTALLAQTYPEPSPLTSCDPDCPDNAFFVLGAQPGFVDALLVPARELLTVALFAAVALWLIRRVRRASELLRLTLLPVLTVAIGRLVVLVIAIAVRAASPESPALDALVWMVALAVPVLAAAFFVGLVERRLYVADALQALGLRTHAHLTREELRAALADALEDPSLDLVFLAEGEDGARGQRAGPPAPAPGTGRTLTEIHDGDRVVAGIVHDDALLDHGEFLEAVAAYALIALENRRLTAAVEASLREVRESRARIVASADSERRRIERDLHDGAQQRLVALGIQLELAERQLADDAPAARERLRSLRADVTATLEEIRALAHGVYPPLLADRGLAAAVRAAARTSPVPATVSPDGVGRYSQEVESAVYFCCLEALQNAGKHARDASAVEVDLRHDGALRFRVRDDGPGFDATASGGAGLTNMRDRLAAVGGELEVHSAPGGGTVVTGVVPLAGRG